MGRTPPGRTREQVLAFVRERLLSGAPPTIREVQAAFRFRSVGTAREHLDALIADGRLARSRGGKHRGLRLPGEPKPQRFVPLLGRVQAGALTEAIADADDHVPIDPRPASQELFALRVRGDSMEPELLADDVLIVRRQATAEHGDLVVAQVDGDATVKRLRFVRGRAELHATNPRYAPIVPDGEPGRQLVLLGKVVELRRHLERRPHPPER